MLPWLVEAQLSYGGVLARLHRASEIQGGTEPTFSLGLALSTLDGPLLCRPCTNPAVLWPTVLWWFALPPFALLGVAVAARVRAAGGALLAVAVASAAAVPYLFLIGYSAPRFLQPTYALLSIPVALGFVGAADWVVTRLGGPSRRVVAGTAAALLVTGLAGHLAVQGALLAWMGQLHEDRRQDLERLTEELHAHGVRPPCLLVGDQAIPIAYHAGCASGASSGANKTADRQELLDQLRRTPSAVLVLGDDDPPSWTRDWQEIRVPGSRRSDDWRVLLSPRPEP